MAISFNFWLKTLFSVFLPLNIKEGVFTMLKEYFIVYCALLRITCDHTIAGYAKEVTFYFCSETKVW